MSSYVYVYMNQNVYMEVKHRIIHLFIMFYFFSLSDILVYEGQRLHISISQILNRYVFFKFFVLRILHLYLLDTARPNYLQELKLKKKEFS